MSFIEKSVGSGEDNEPPPTASPLLFSSSSSSHHHHHHHLQQQQQPQPQPFFSPPLYGNHNGGSLLDCGEQRSSDPKELAGSGWLMVEREHMFDKVVTPSDVGKLNRLVIPKQHAERYFPLDSSTNYKGLLLNFEDRNGKLWRFQYSYWNSSQSYVMTKGWSRFVKEKRLDAGDIVSFQRGVGVTAKDRLFIDWRRRVNANPSVNQPYQLSSSSSSYLFPNHNFIHPWNNPLVLQSFPARSTNPDLMLHVSNTNPNSSSISRSVYFQPPQQFMLPERSDLGRSDLGLGFGFDAPEPAVHQKGSGKRRLRLFGVNMDCVFSEDREDDRDATIAGCRTGSSIIPSSSSSCSFSTIPYLQLTPCGGEIECDQGEILLSASDHDLNIMSKSEVSNISLDLKMSHTEGEI